MKKTQENKEKEGKQLFAEFQELYLRLSLWQRIHFNFCIKWIVLQRHWGKCIWDWLIFQWKMDEKIKIRFASSATNAGSMST